MPTFIYAARDIQGRPVSGTLSGPDERAIREQLRDRELYVTRVAAQGAAAAARAAGAETGFRPFAGRVKLYDIVVFSRQLSTLVKAGLSLTEALTGLARQTRNPTLRAATGQIHKEIATGSSLTAAMKQHPRIFSELYLSLAEAGELGGMLDETLDTAATALDKEMEIRERVKSAFVQPVAVLVVAWGVVTALLMFVVPVFDKVYKQFKAELPAITKLLITISGLLRDYWWAGALLTLVAVVVCARVYKTHRGRRFFDGLLIKVPLVGHLIEKIALSRLAHTLSDLTNAGIPLIRALGTAGRVSGNSLMVDALGQVSAQVQQGAGMCAAMVATGRFPQMMTQMIGAGENAGNLGEMLEQVGQFYDREVDYGVKRLMTLMEPILTVGLGVLVGFILLALYSPIFNMGNVIK